MAMGKREASAQIESLLKEFLGVVLWDKKGDSIDDDIDDYAKELEDSNYVDISIDLGVLELNFEINNNRSSKLEINSNGMEIKFISENGDETEITEEEFKGIVERLDEKYNTFKKLYGEITEEIGHDQEDLNTKVMERITGQGFFENDRDKEIFEYLYENAYI